MEITARPNWYKVSVTDAIGYTESTPTFGEFICEEGSKKPRGFCFNPKCPNPEGSRIFHTVKRKKHKGYWTTNRKQANCPHCASAMYWTINWASEFSYKEPEMDDSLADDDSE